MTPQLKGRHLYTFFFQVVCDLRDVRVPKRFLNVTATDGEYYSDVMSIKVELGGEGRMTHLKVNRTTPPSENGSSSSSSSPRSGIKLFSTANSVFECEDTGVRERFDQMAALSEKNNQFEDGEEGFPPLPSRYRDNVHTPQWIDVPKEISVKNILFFFFPQFQNYCIFLASHIYLFCKKGSR